MIQLKSSHLYITAAIARRCFGEEPSVLISYNPDASSLMMASGAEKWFKKLHGGSEHLLKERNFDRGQNRSLA